MLDGSHRDCTPLLCPGILSGKGYSLRVTRRGVVSLTILAAMLGVDALRASRTDNTVYQRARGVHTPGCIVQPPGLTWTGEEARDKQGVS